MRTDFFILYFLFVITGMYSQTVLNDNHHGDPPYLFEEGWIPLINGEDLEGWNYVDESKVDSWTATKSIFWDQSTNPNLLKAVPGAGDRLVNLPFEGGASNLVSVETAGDMELYIEYMIPENSGSGIYVHGLYEFQIWNSYGIEPRFPTDQTGTLYSYADRQGAILPKVRAERPQGQWNAFHIWFQAPRFDSSGKKIENAKFLRVLLNGQTIHENQERIEGTHACLEIPEAAQNPVVMLQGGYGSVAFRNIYVKPLK